MGWLSLATRVIPKLWRSGAKVTSTLWKGGSSVVGAVAKNPKTTAGKGHHKQGHFRN